MRNAENNRASARRQHVESLISSSSHDGDWIKNQHYGCGCDADHERR